MKGNKKDIFKNLKNKGTGFSSPNNYFSNFENNFLKKKTNVSNTSGFIIPKNYFENFDDKIFAALKSPKIILLNNKRVIKFSLMVAATLLLFISISNFEFAKHPMSMDDIEINEMANWIDNDLVSYNTYEISEIFSDTDLDIELVNSEIDASLNYLEYTDIESLMLENQ
ncbi:MAG: hypothetical protein L3J34_05220 [Flavobacteriaceae bacterium]|nr:hypothetical protein [Flavobacteriaceae bacterium]